MNNTSKVKMTKEETEMLLIEDFKDWIIKEDIHPRIDLREEEGSYLCDGDYEGNGHLMVSTNVIIQYIRKLEKERRKAKFNFKPRR